MRDSFDLCSLGLQSWAKELRDLLVSLPVAVITQTWLFDNARERGWCEKLKVRVTEAFAHWMRAEISVNGRLQVLRACTPRSHPGSLPRYLRISNANHRRALTRLVFSEHPLAVEVLRHGDHFRIRMERHERLCRFCFTQVEDECHALWDCGACVSLSTRRRHFLESLENAPPLARAGTLEAIATLLEDEDFCATFGEYVFDVLETFAAVPIYVPARFIIRNRDSTEESD